MNFLLVMPKSASLAAGGQNIFPIGLAYVSSSLKQSGFNVITENLQLCQQDTCSVLNELIRKHAIDVIATSGLSRDYYKVKEVIDAARAAKTDILTVVGGGIVSSDPETAMIALGADIGVIGEGEATICELAKALESGLQLIDVNGIIFRQENDRFRTTQERSEIKSIDTIPFPDFEGFSYSKYIQSTGSKAIYVLASRSCPYLCTFCFHPTGRKYRQRSLDNLFEEIDLLVKNYQPDYLRVSDELFSYKKDRLYEFCERIAEYKIKWSSTLRVSDVDGEMLKTMKASGCNEICFGVEHSEKVILKSMRKNISIEKIESALEHAWELNINVVAGILFGDVAETAETAKNALVWHEKNSKYGLMLNMIDVFPGTHLYKNAWDRGIIKDKVEFLRKGCPLTNVTSMSDEEYKNIASLVYERNMRPIHPPRSFEILAIESPTTCQIGVDCERCGARNVIRTDFLYTVRMRCESCNQAYYVDPFQKACHNELSADDYFGRDEIVAIWGAGEICIKLINNFPFFNDERFVVVDYSISRQGCSVRDKKIFSPGHLNSLNINTVIIAVTKRKNEVLNQITTEFPRINRIFVPDVEVSGDRIVPVLNQLQL